MTMDRWSFALRPSFIGDYQAALEHLQAGRWEEAIKLLTTLQEQYPKHPELEALLEQAQLKSALAQKQPGITRARLLSWLGKAPLLRRVILAVMAFVAVSAVILVYARAIAPAQAEEERLARQARLLREGQQALAVGAYERAAEAFRQLLAQVPDSVPAQEGLALAEQRLALARKYQTAVELEQTGRLQEALELFQDLNGQAPGYADVSQRVSALKRRLDIQRLYEEATQAYEARRWADAATAYETVRGLDLEFRPDEISQRLFESYSRQAYELIAEPITDERAQDLSSIDQQATQALHLLNEALSLRPRDATARSVRAQLSNYLRGVEAAQAQRWEEAVDHLEQASSVADQWMSDSPSQPSALRLGLAYHLCQAYLELGKALEEQGDPLQAIERYRSALALVDRYELWMDDPSFVAIGDAARQRLEALLPLTVPTATPTPTPLPTPTPTPTPTPLPLSAYRGWIAFKTDREGGERVYVMRPDGSDPRPISDPENYAKLEEREAYSPDGTRRVYNEGDERSTPLYIWRYDVPPTWERRRQLLDNSAINYQPAWSPQGNLIAFVSQKSGGDEIWIISADEREEHPTPKRLTFNDWEWDKHPTWSPDGQYIAFWSNRETGRRQIWVMRADGSDPINISRNEYNDWDPIWIK